MIQTSSPSALAIAEGRPFPRGASLDGSGTNFALFSAHATRVELCLFDTEGHETRVDLPAYTDEVWHGYLPDLQPGQLYAYRVHGPYGPTQGHRFNANKLLIDPYARELSGDLVWCDELYGYTVGHPDKDLSFDERDSAPFVPKAVAATIAMMISAVASISIPSAAISTSVWALPAASMDSTPYEGSVLLASRTA